MRLTPQNRNFTSVFDVQRPFRAKGLRRIPQNRNFTSVFEVHYRAKGLRRIPQNRNFTSVFDVQRHFAPKGCGGYLKIVILPQFLTFNVHFVRKGCGGDLKIVILPRFWKSEVHEMLCLSRFAALRRHRPRLRREKEERAKERRRERRSTDVKVPGSRSADVKV